MKTRVILSGCLIFLLGILAGGWTGPRPFDLAEFMDRWEIYNTDIKKASATHDLSRVSVSENWIETNFSDVGPGMPCSHPPTPGGAERWFEIQKIDWHSCKCTAYKRIPGK